MACAVVPLLLCLAGALDGFSIGGPGGVRIVWMRLGVVASWLVCAWALIYRSVNSRKWGLDPVSTVADSWLPC